MLLSLYTAHHSVTAAARVFFFSRKLNHIILSIKRAYLEGMKENRTVKGSGDYPELPAKKRGRRLLLGANLDWKVQLYLKVRKGGVVSPRVAMAAAKGIMLMCDRSI